MNSGLQVYNKQEKLAQWAQVVSQCRDSGLLVRQWCQEYGVNVSSYYKWQRKVYATAKAQQERRFVEVTPVQPVAVWPPGQAEDGAGSIQQFSVPLLRQTPG